MTALNDMPLPSYAKPDLWLDENNALEFIRWKDETEPYMAHWWHRSNVRNRIVNERGWCMGGCAWRKPAGLDAPWTPWTLVSWEPLTISPSLLCYGCGAHGFIEKGTWRPV